MMTEDNASRFDALFESAVDYGKTSFDLIKLQAVKESTDLVSTLIPHAIVLTFVSTCMLLFSVGLAFLIGEAIENIFYGFFIVAGLYGLVALVLHFIFHKLIKKYVRQCLINKFLN